MRSPIYMDNNATTRVDPRVLERMLPYFCDDYGNAASRSHPFGWKAEEAVELARRDVATLIGATPTEIIWTSGATESNNLALFGVCDAYAAKGDHVITQLTEHKAVLDACTALQARGVQITHLPVDAHGQVDPEAVRDALRPTTVLVSIMHANNEVGTLQPLAQIGQICKAAGVLFHSDIAQSAGKIAVDVKALGVDLASLSAHKLYGPKGVGALYVRRRGPRVTLTPQIHGGGHERGMRSGTLNVPGIVGFGTACRLAAQELPAEGMRLATLRDRLWDGLRERLDGVTRNGHPMERLPGNLNLSVAGVEGEALLLSLREVAVSSGSACTSATLEPSYVLRAMGVASELAHASLRFGLGRFNTEQDVATVVELVPEQVDRLRQLNGRQRRGTKHRGTEHRPRRIKGDDA